MYLIWRSALVTEVFLHFKPTAGLELTGTIAISMQPVSYLNPVLPRLHDWINQTPTHAAAGKSVSFVMVEKLQTKSIQYFEELTFGGRRWCGRSEGRRTKQELRFASMTECWRNTLPDSSNNDLVCHRSVSKSLIRFFVAFTSLGL
jgi:hypothetical protein